jgi:hypothetical protein
MGVVRIVTGCRLEGRGLTLGKDRVFSFAAACRPILGPSHSVTGLSWDAKRSLREGLRPVQILKNMELYFHSAVDLIAGTEINLPV